MAKKPTIVAREVKLAYVEQILQKKLEIPQVAQELGVRTATVYDWLKKYREDPRDFMPGSGSQKPLEAENRRLEKENRQLAAEVAFLKKAAVYFAADHKQSMP